MLYEKLAEAFKDSNDAFLKESNIFPVHASYTCPTTLVLSIIRRS